MRGDGLGLTVVGGLAALIALGPGPGAPGATPAAAAVEGARGAKPAAPRFRPAPRTQPTVRRRKPSLYEARVSPATGYAFGYAPSFAARPYGRAYAEIRMVLNPYVPSGYPATPEYRYLYTLAPAYRAAPAAASHRYLPDNSYLLRPAPGYEAVAAAYGWKYCGAGMGPTARSRGGARAGRDRPAVGRNPGQKIDNALKPEVLAAGGEDASWQQSAALGRLRLADALRPPSPGVADPNDPCLKE